MSKTIDPGWAGGRVRALVAGMAIAATSFAAPAGAAPPSPPRVGVVAHPTAATADACLVPSDCDDGNPCTADDCVGMVCQNVAVPDGTACDDGDPCTTGDACEAGTCVPTTGNPISWENCRPGNPSSEWDVSGAGDESIQGFATDISVNRGDTVFFKIATDATAYRIDVYRMGYYGGLGARKVATALPSATLPQAQPACLTAPPDSGHAGSPPLVDCGNWAVSASWTVPPGAASGIYFAKLVREDPEDGRASHIVFVVRDDGGGSDILFKTSDTTWQAYNLWGPAGLVAGSSLYGGPGGNAYKLSYNRPFSTRLSPTEDWVFNAEYPMARWLERNGYDVSYCAGVDTERNGAGILNHRALLSVGHDEYWSRGMRDNVTAARDAGVHLGFFSGNEIYWKIRWENSIDGSSTPYRTLVCYKEGTLGELGCGGKCDPLTTVWTGLWRDGCAFPLADGCQPENALSGQISWDGTSYAIRVPDAYSGLRFWRDTSIAALLPGQTKDLPDETLGYEWDFQQYFDSYPPGLVRLSSATYGAKTHQLSLYRNPSGALVFGAGSVQWSWGLDATHDRGGNPPDSDMQQATVNLLADMGIQPATLQPGLQPATASTDATPPTSAITSPADGASVSGLVTIAGTASDAGGGHVGGVEVSADGGSTWHEATGRESWSYDWTATQTGPTTLLSRAVDDSGNLEAPGPGVGVTVTARTCPCTIWSDASVPANPAVNDGQSIELGVKFRAERDGYITALRFYKGAANTGTHTANLWSATGTLLSSQVYTTETASGWQEVTLPSPVAVTANTTYVASYFSSGGFYAFDGAYFTAPLDNPPLAALADGTDGPNGVYAYGAVSTFPTSSYNASNYWVDVVFNDTATDTIPPTVVAELPAPNATNVSVGTTVRATFSEAVQEGSIGFSLRDATGSLVPAVVSYDAPLRTSTLTPLAPLAFDAVYTASVTGAQDLAGNPMSAPFSWSFTTAGPPADEGPGGPILVITDAAAPVGRFMAEVLRTEGFNEFTATDVSNLSPSLLAGHEIAILASMPLTADEVTTLTNWVAGGGKLVALKPDKQLAGLLGLTDLAATLSEGYLLADTSQAPGLGIVGQTVQFHGDADLYALNGARAAATLYSDATTPTASPAVSFRSVGSNGGWAAAFTYDLPWSLVYTRQGNPAWAGDERDGTTPIRSDDLFFGAKAGDPQPDWVDLDKVAIPQADEQQRLLANLILSVSARPLPRFWYFPSGTKAVIVMTDDEHGGGSGSRSRFDSFLAKDPPGCVVDDWECVRGSAYIYPNGDLTDAEAVTYTAEGFELGTHVNTGCADFTEASLRADYTGDLDTFATYYPDLPQQDSLRTHCVAWSDWSSQPKIKEEKGIRLDVDYYYWPEAWIAPRYAGMFTGSGMPMRFVAPDGSMFDVYQAATQMTDESGQPYPSTVDALLDRAVGPEGYYGAFTVNIHGDNGLNDTTDLIVDSAQARGVPVVSGRQMLRWLDGRNASAFASQTWDGTTLGFTITLGSGARNAMTMLPTTVGGAALTSLTVDGSPVAFTTETVKGIEYASFPAVAGGYVATYVPDTTPPTISSVAAVAHGDGTALVTWITDEPSDSRVDFGTDPQDLSLGASSASLVTSHAVVLSGLVADTTYHYRVTSADAAANASTEPAPPADPLTFTTPAPVCFTDTTAADFVSGMPDPAAYVSETAGGEIILGPTEGSEFSGSTLPAGWTTILWDPAGSVTIGGGSAAVDGALLATSAFYGPGRSVELRATFTADAGQHAGFGTDLNATPWAIFSTKDGGSLWARTSTTETQLPGVTLGVPHTFRIDWGAAEVDYWVDGVEVATHTVAIPDLMRPVASDLSPAGGLVGVDWMRMTPYASSASFVSRVFGDGSYRTWRELAWTADEPPGTSVSLSVRTGNVPVPDGTWSSWTPVATSGATIGVSSYYMQYRADLGTTDPATTPALDDVSISCEAMPDTTPPTITGRSPVPGATGVAASTGVTATFSEPMDPATITMASFRLRAQGAGSDVPAVVATTGAVATLTPTASLDPAATYTVTVDGTVADLAENPLGAPDSWTFTTAAASSCLTDSTVAELASGDATGGTYVAETADGEVLLAPTVGAEFSGSVLPAGWSSTPWTGGTSTVSGGSVTVDGALLATDGYFSPGRALEAVATFSAVAFEHVGLGTDLNGPPWAMFSTHNTGSALYARTNDGVTSTDVLIPGSWLGGPHRYRIEWAATEVRYIIDGTLEYTAPFSPAASLRPVVSDYQTDGTGVVVDWLRLSPYPASGTFVSRVLDAGQAAQWQTLAAAGTLPAGTSYSFETRSGDTPVPDGTWSSFAPAAAGSIASPDGRYLQYRATLATGDPDRSPELASVTVCSVSCQPADCDDGNPCTVDSCAAGVCQHTPATDGTTCDDGNPCTSGDACNAGTCGGSTVPGCCLTDAECDDGNACTTDTCGPAHTCGVTAFTCSLDGRIAYYRDSTDPEGVDDGSDKGVPGVVVTMTGDASGSTTTAADVGTFSFAAGGDETVAPAPTAGLFVKPGIPGAMSGVTSLDASWIAQSTVELRALTPLQTIAADVSGNGAVSSFDAALIAQLVVGTIARFPVADDTGSDWAFVPSSRAVRVQDVDTTGVDFTGILYGDVTGNWGEPVAGLRTASGAVRDEDPETYAFLAARASAARASAPAPASRGATIYVASGPRRLPDGRVEVVLGIRGADGILGLDLSLVAASPHAVEATVETTELSSGMVLTQNATPDRYAISLFGATPMAGAGPFLKIVYRSRTGGLSLPLSIAAEANEGAIPIALGPGLGVQKGGPGSPSRGDLPPRRHGGIRESKEDRTTRMGG